MKDKTLHFKVFLHDVQASEFDTNITTSGTTTIQQTERNRLRKEGVSALKKDLEALYADEFDIVETKEGIVIVAESDD